jgi:hypothetical protein
MRKTIVFLSLVVACVSIIRLLIPYSPFQLIGIDEPIAWIGFAVSSMGILFEWEWLQRLNLGNTFHVLSCTLFGLTIFGVISPTYGGILSNYIHMADNFVTLESAVILWLLGSEQRDDKTPFFLYVGFTSELIIRTVGQRVNTLRLNGLHRSRTNA